MVIFLGGMILGSLGRVVFRGRGRGVGILSLGRKRDLVSMVINRIVV